MIDGAQARDVFGLRPPGPDQCPVLVEHEDRIRQSQAMRRSATRLDHLHGPALDARPVLARAHVDGRAVEVGYRNAGDAVCSPDRAETVLLVADEVRVWRGV